MPEKYYLTELVDTPIGPLGLAGSSAGLARISLFGLAGLARQKWDAETVSSQQVFEAAREGRPAFTALAAALQQLEEYLAGRRRVFDLQLDLSGIPPARLAILKICQAIPFGEVHTYAWLAAQAGKPSAPILAGSAMAANPLPLVIPCHRAVGTDGRLHGFGAPGGLATKAYLLEMEGHKIVNQKLA